MSSLIRTELSLLHSHFGCTVIPHSRVRREVARYDYTTYSSDITLTTCAIMSCSAERSEEDAALRPAALLLLLVLDADARRLVDDEQLLEEEGAPHRRQLDAHRHHARLFRCARVAWQLGL